MKTSTNPKYKTVIDHEIRKALGITCQEYVFLDFIFQCNCKRKNTFHGDDFKAIGFDDADILKTFFSVKKMSFLETNKNIVHTTAKWNEHFVNENAIPEIIVYLNTVLGSSFKSESGDTKKHIKARLKEGYTFDGFKMVIDSRNNEWGEDAQMRQYLRPATLFGNKFESYLQYAIANSTKPITHGRERQTKPTNFDHLKGAYSDITD